MRIETKYSGLDRAISKLERYYGKIITSNEATGKFAKDLILSRVATGKTVTNVKMKYTPKGGKKPQKAIGDYSASHGSIRSKRGLGTAPMDLKFTGGLYNAFSYRKSQTASTISLRLYIKNSSTRNKNPISYPKLVSQFEERFGSRIFYPSMSEISQIKKFYKNSLR